jgi:hypothetical protein
MLETEKQTIIEFLRSTDPDMDIDADSTMEDCIEMMMDKISEMELDYSILSTAFVNGVDPQKFEDFHEQVMLQYENIPDGEEIPENILDMIASYYR